MKSKLKFFIVLMFLLEVVFLPQAWAFNPPEDTAGPLTVRMDGPAVMTEHVSALSVTLANKGNEAIQGRLRLGVVDDWSFTPQEPVSFALGAGEQTRQEFTLKCGTNTYNALYPVHAWAECNGYAAHAVLIVETRLPDPPQPALSTTWIPMALGPDSALPLWRVPVHRTVLKLFADNTTLVEPVGWQGEEGGTRTWVVFDQTVDRGGARQAISVHPPWNGGRVGTALLEFPLNLPAQTPLRLRFAHAIRTHDAARGEPPSDGVTFRVRVAPIEAAPETLGEILFERHSAAMEWQPAEVDMSAFAGKSICLQLETHPGPKQDPTCDQSFWGAPEVVAGTPPEPKPPTKPEGMGTLIGKTDADVEIRVWTGARGLLDSVVGFCSPEKSLYFRGFQARVERDPLEDARSITRLIFTRHETGIHGAFAVMHRFEGICGGFDLLGELWVEGNALRAKFQLENTPAPQPWQNLHLEDIAVGPWSEAVTRVYAGTGNVLVNPEAFSLGCDGHQLATSFVGAEFTSGMALVQGVNTPPERLEVNPNENVFSLHAAHAQTMTFIPALTVWDGVKQWRALDPRPAAGGVKKLAGRFVFDLWGGRYGESAAALKRAFRYGLTDSMVVWHNWQRWGYDYRLPDIFPPNPDLGTMEDFKKLANTCRDAGVLFAPHDNYIDVYPDADGYSYANISFTEGRQPVRAWLNEGRQAQAYRWRADVLRPYVERNLKLIRDAFAPSAYFIDVWSSIRPYDYWTRDGQFFDCISTRNTWGELFSWIRDYLGEDAPQISESGHDQLIGWLDGGQTNHLRVDADTQGQDSWFTWRVRAKDSERIPWIDAAYHDRFVLHGAGYDGRYRAGSDARLHGINSDDYMATEALTGHPAMTHAPFGRDVVRKYWLMHALGRALALKEIARVEFDGNNPHRQHVTWDNGAEVWVNRGAEEWTAAEHVLPRYGFYAKSPVDGGILETAIERRGGGIAEWSRGPDGFYVNGRVEPLVRVEVASLKLTGERTLELALNWNSVQPLETDWMVFVHFVDAKGTILFQADHAPGVPTTQWKGSMQTTARVEVPAVLPLDRCVELRVGLWREGVGRCGCLEGLRDGQQGLRLGQVEWKQTEGRLSGIKWSPYPLPEESYAARVNPNGEAVDFGGVITAGACLIRPEGDSLVVMPLPDSKTFTVRLDWEKLPWNLQKPAMVELWDEGGMLKETRTVGGEGGPITLTVEPGGFSYYFKS